MSIPPSRVLHLRFLTDVPSDTTRNARWARASAATGAPSRRQAFAHMRRSPPANPNTNSGTSMTATITVEMITLGPNAAS